LSSAIDSVDAYLERTADERLAEYIEFLRIPTIGVLAAHDADVRAGADWLVEHMRAIGLENVVASPTPGHPVVYGDWLHAEGSPTVIVYCHYDVQPVDPIELWERPPFEPHVADGRIFARGAADDKGQIHLHLWAARAWLATAGRLPVNVRYVFEGEEESGSTHFEAWLEASRGLVQGDVVVISDTSFFEGNHPALTIGLRGNVYLQIDVAGPDQDLHSGQFGGLVQNPANALTQILASLRNTDGTVAVPGFYDDSTPLGAEDREALAKLPFDDDALAAQIGVAELFGEPRYSALERRGARPTLDICGMWSGFQGEGTKTIIPAHAHAKVSCRLTLGMDPMRTFERVRDAIHAVDVPGVTVDVSLTDVMDPFSMPVHHPAMQAAARCLEEVFGQPPFYLREGGSIGAVATFDRIVGAPVVMLGFANADDQAHAPNESMVLANYEGGARTVARYWEALAER
jgi:acetylornithine deacetylase/succinyl-diaminopimelate desuccinylase-like protein